MEQTRALNALQPYLALSKTATSPRAAADVVVQATSAPHTYVFAELLQTPQIQALRGPSADPQYASYYTLLEIFAWGTWADYQASSTTLPTLSPAQQHKLRLLTLLTVASSATSSSNLTYAALSAHLGLPPTPSATTTTSSSAASPRNRELETLVTDAIYASLLTATLNSASQLLSVSSIAPLRDLAPGSVTAMLADLEAWSTRCEAVLADLDAEGAKVRAKAAERKQWDSIRAAQVTAAEKGGPENKGNAGTRGPAGHTLRPGGSNLREEMGGEEGDEDLMDLDDAPGGAVGGKKKGGSRFGLRKR